MNKPGAILSSTDVSYVLVLARSTTSCPLSGAADPFVIGLDRFKILDDGAVDPVSWKVCPLYVEDGADGKALERFP